MTYILGVLAMLTTTSLALAQVRQGAWTPVEESMDRGYSSISYWTYRDDGVEIGGGRVSVEHGKPGWPQSLSDEAAFDAATLGKLWRLGNNKWTTLDSQLPLDVGGRRIEPGIYYLVLERPAREEWRLAFVDPQQVRPSYIDAWAAQARPDEVPILFAVPLSHSGGATTETLDITLALDENDMSRAVLRIEWGPHRLETEVTIEVPSPTFYRRTTEGEP